MLYVFYVHHVCIAGYLYYLLRVIGSDVLCVGSFQFILSALLWHFSHLLLLQQLVTVMFAPTWQLSHDILASHWSMLRNKALLLVDKGREHDDYEQKMITCPHIDNKFTPRGNNFCEAKTFGLWGGLCLDFSWYRSSHNLIQTIINSWQKFW